MKTCFMTLCAILLFLPQIVSAGEADVLDVKISKAPDGFDFSVTLKHADEGWNHYADRWEIVAPAGQIIATRTLYHPHVNEQPFVRSLAGVDLPAGLSSVQVRAHDSVHEYGGRTLEVDLP